MMGTGEVLPLKKKIIFIDYQLDEVMVDCTRDCTPKMTRLNRSPKMTPKPSKSDLSHLARVIFGNNA